MGDNGIIASWIGEILKRIRQLPEGGGESILEQCGRDCATRGSLLPGALTTRAEASDGDDREALFRVFKRNHYDTPGFFIEGDTITLILDHCTCPLVEAGVTDPALCACTAGYSKAVFEALFDATVKVELEQTILRGDSACVQRIRIMD